ncbi:MAG: hypothetical protein MUF04_10340, partial [Akkermansiaceae bacterium]|nr:hypothetical protein [Akkermansiaceae bacterium]
GNNVTVSDLGCLTVNVLGPSGATIGGLRGDGDVAPQYQLSNSNSRTITISPASDSHAFDGRIRNGASGSVLSVVKSGSGTQIFGTDSTGSYTGTTTVSAGKLVINGNFSAATGAVSVGADGTLGGTGIIGGATTVSGTLAAGNSTGLLTFNSTLALAGGAAFEIHGTARGAAVGGYDAVDVGGALTYGGTLTALFGTSFGAGSYNFDLFDFDGQSGTLDSLGIAGSYSGTLNPDNGWALTSGTESWGFNHSTGVLSLTVVPEPGVALLGGLGLVALLRRRRRDWA